MKKVLILAALAFGAYRFLGQEKAPATTPGPILEEDDAPQGSSQGAPDAASFFRTYDKKVVIDAKNYYMLVKDGKLYTPTNIDSLVAYEKANPGSQVKVSFDAWEPFANSSTVGGSF